MVNEKTLVSRDVFDYRGKVYDLNVNEVHNYFVNGVLAHNSAAGSEVVYLLGIVEIDPIKNDLYFSRFLNKARKGFPDIDVDFATMKGHPESGKNMTIDSLSKDAFPFAGQIVNESRASTLILFKYLAKSFGIPFQDVNKVTTDPKVSDGYFKLPSYDSNEDPSMNNWLEKELRSVGLNFDNRWRELEKYIPFCYRYGGFKRGDNAEGLLWNTSAHASGVILYPDDDLNVLPKNSQGVTYRGHALEEMGYIKYDMLGLESLDPISHFIPIIEKDTGKPFRWEDTFDEETWEKVFQTADTDFVFQFASPGMKKALLTVKPNNITKLAELNALYRPGCINAGIFKKYLEDSFTEDDLVVGSFLQEEFGKDHCPAMIFQEDIMKIVNKMAGFSLSDADLVRRAIQRKQADVMDSYKKQFIENFDTEKYGDIAEKVWNAIDEFAAYCFNKSHSVAYACIAYWTAYIYCHYRNQYFEYMISIGKDKKEIIDYLSKDHEIVFPSLSTKNTEYVVTDDKVLIPTVSVCDEGIADYLLHLDSDKKKMIVKYGILDGFCYDRKGIREIFSSIPKKKIKELSDTDLMVLNKSKNFLSLLKSMSALEMIDYKKTSSKEYDVTVHKAKSDVVIHINDNPTGDVLKFNCQEDLRAYGTVRSDYVDLIGENGNDSLYIDRINEILEEQSQQMRDQAETLNSFVEDENVKKKAIENSYRNKMSHVFSVAVSKFNCYAPLNDFKKSQVRMTAGTPTEYRAVISNISKTRSADLIRVTFTLADYSFEQVFSEKIKVGGVNMENPEYILIKRLGKNAPVSLQLAIFMTFVGDEPRVEVKATKVSERND